LEPIETGEDGVLDDDDAVNQEEGRKYRAYHYILLWIANDVPQHWLSDSSSSSNFSRHFQPHARVFIGRYSSTNLAGHHFSSSCSFLFSFSYTCWTLGATDGALTVPIQYLGLIMTQILFIFPGTIQMSC